MAAAKPVSDFLLYIEPEGSDEVKKQEEAIMDSLSKAEQATEQFSQRALEAAEQRDALAEEVSEAISSKSANLAHLESAMQRTRAEGNHCQNEEWCRTKSVQERSRQAAILREACPNTRPRKSPPIQRTR